MGIQKTMDQKLVRRKFASKTSNPEPDKANGKYGLMEAVEVPFPILPGLLPRDKIDHPEGSVWRKD
jgi:hypothetical protein